MADEAEAGTTLEAPSRSDVPTGEGPGLGAIAGILAAAGLFVSGAAFLIGWRYSVAFYERLGIPVQALDLEAADYITAKVAIWYSLVTSAGVVLGLALIVWQARVTELFLPVSERAVRALFFACFLGGGRRPHGGLRRGHADRRGWFSLCLFHRGRICARG